MYCYRDFARAQAERGILEQTLLHHRYLGRPYEVTTCSDAYQASRWQVFSPHQSTGHDSNLTELIERHGQLTVFILVRAGGTTYWVPSGGAPATWSWHWGSAVQVCLKSVILFHRDITSPKFGRNNVAAVPILCQQ